MFGGNYVSISNNDYILRGNIKKDAEYFIFEFTNQAFSLLDTEGSVSEEIPLSSNTKIKMKYENSKFEIINIETSTEYLKNLKVGDVFKSEGGGL